VSKSGQVALERLLDELLASGDPLLEHGILGCDLLATITLSGD
jgi:hypothetical protein